MDFRDFLAHNGSFGGKIGEGIVRCSPQVPNEVVLTFGVVTSVPLLVKISQEMRPSKCGQTDTRCM